MSKHLDLNKIAIIAITILAFALRTYHLGHQSIWYDEGVSLYYSRQSLNDLIVNASADNHPPLHYLVLHFWLKLAGQSEFSVRLPSLISGVLSIPLLFKLGQELFDQRVGLLAAFLLSISPFHVWFSQEARMYTLAVLFSLASVYIFVLRLEEKTGSARRCLWPGYVITSALGLYTHFYVALVLLFENVFFLAWWILGQVKRQILNVKRPEWPDLRTWLLAQLGVVFLFLPWARFAATRYITDATYWEGTLDLLTATKDTFIAFSVGHTLGGKAADFAALGFAALAAVGMLASLWEWKLAIRRRKTEGERLSIFDLPSSNLQSPTGLILLHLLVPIGALLAISYHRPKFAPRYLLPALPAFYLLVAVGMGKLVSSYRRVRSSRLVSVMALIALLSSLGFASVASASSLANYYFDARYARPDFRAVAEYISSHAEGEDAIILVGGFMLPAFTYYYRGDLPIYPIPAGVVVSTREPLDYRAAAQLNSIAQGRDRLWLVLWQNRLVDPTDVILDQLMLNCPRLGVDRNFHQFALLLFSLENRPRFGTGPQHRYLAEFADHIQLLGYDLDSFQTEPGQTLHLALYWESTGQMAQNYLVFTHLLSADERICGQHDKIAGHDTFPTSHWQKGTIIRDKFEIFVHPGTPPGRYTIEVGLYTNYRGTQRLPLKTGGDRVLLSQIVVGP